MVLSGQSNVGGIVIKMIEILDARDTQLLYQSQICIYKVKCMSSLDDIIALTVKNYSLIYETLAQGIPWLSIWVSWCVCFQGFGCLNGGA